VARARQRGKLLLGLAGIVAGGIALSAVQLFTGLDEGRESMRSLGMSYEFASSFSFPPENFLTLVAPGCFGDGKNVEYYGRWYVTEVSLFVSVTGLALAVYGMARGARATRRFAITMLIITLVLAMGCYTPVFPLLYNYVPGFNLFRGMDKFLWLAALFLSMLAGVGLDQMLRGRHVPWWLIGGAAGVGIALCGLSIVPRQLDRWAGVLQMIVKTNAAWWPDGDFADPRFIAQTSAQCIHSLIEGAVCLFLAAGLFTLAKSRRRIACGGMLLMAAIELACFAHNSLMTFPIGAAYSPSVVNFLAQHPGDYRIKCDNPNRCMTTGALDIGGADPSGLLRYARYASFTAGINYNTLALGMTTEKKSDPQAWRMLRCRFIILESQNAFTPIAGALPRLLLVDRFRVMTNYQEIFSTLTDVSFHVENEVILESQPDPAPQPAREIGTVRMLESSTDYLTVEAEAKTPCLLFITDAYSSGWRALALPGSSQARYQIMPANYCLRAIPLAAGHHLLRVEYSPLGFRVGKVVSIAAWAIFIVLTGLAAAQNSQWSRRPKIETGPRAAL
jgi:hypothetical protein